MCRMLVYVGPRAKSPADILGNGLAELVDLSHEHCHGWGEATMDSAPGKFAVRRCLEPAFMCNEFARVSRMPGKNVMLHLRQASTGMGQGFESSHPFIADGMAFCHNGVFKHPDRLRKWLASVGGPLPKGICDSEAYFCAIRYFAQKMDLPQAIAAAANKAIEVSDDRWLALNTMVLTDQGVYVYNLYKEGTAILRDLPDRYRIQVRGGEAGHGFVAGSQDFSLGRPGEQRWMRNGQMLFARAGNGYAIDVTPTLGEASTAPHARTAANQQVRAGVGA